MNFDMFLAFALFSCVLIFLGYYLKPEVKVLAVLGFATLFFLGLLLQFSGVSERIGLNVSSSGSSSVVVYSYGVIADSTSVWIGRWLSIVSALACALVFMSNRGGPDED
jgi:hypothetical protein